MNEQDHIKRIQQMQARLEKEKALLRKRKRAADNKRKYLLGAHVLAELGDSSQLRKWVLKVFSENPPRDKSNQEAITPLLEEIAKQEGVNVPVLPVIESKKKKAAEPVKGKTEAARAAIAGNG